MDKLIQKLSSRKFWAAVVGMVVGVAAAFGISENDFAQVAGLVTTAVSVVSYIFGEAQVDAARVEQPQVETQVETETLDGWSEK